MKPAKQYVDSLGKLKMNLYLFGEKVDDWVNYPIIRPSINAVAMTYKIANESENNLLTATTSSINGKEENLKPLFKRI